MRRIGRSELATFRHASLHASWSAAIVFALWRPTSTAFAEFRGTTGRERPGADRDREGVERP